MAETLFPHRKRCRSCRARLGADYADTVLFGLYCCADCAGVPQAGTDPEQAPRECVTYREGSWQFKRIYRCVQEIPKRLRTDASADWYTCSFGHIHIGHTRMGAAEQFRMFQRSEDVADLLVKLRGSATRKQVAAAAKVRPVRVKELEEGIGHPENLVTLMKVLSVLQARLGVSMKG